MYKLIACDLDETLLQSDCTVSEKDAESIKKAVAKGVKFVLATGRGFNTVQGTLRSIGLEDMENEYVISFNGAVLSENHGNRVIRFEGLDFETVKTLFEAGLKYDVCIHVYAMDTTYVWNMNQDEYDYVYRKAVLSYLEEPDIDFLKDTPLTKIIYQNTDMDYLRKIDKELAELTKDLDVSYSANRYLEFNSNGINKGRGLKDLAEYLNIDISETIAVGDNYNDLPMLKAAGLGIGVANTIESMKPECDFITDATHNENAISEVIERFVL